MGRAGGRRRRDHHHGERQGHLRKRRPRLLRVRVGLHEPARRARSAAGRGRTSCEECDAMAELARRRADPGAAGHPRQVPDGPLRGSLGGLQPDPHRRGVRSLGRAARAGSCTASGRWPRSRARRREAAGRPRAPQAPVGAVPRHGAARAGGRSSAARFARCSDGRAIVDTVAEQAGNQIIRNAEAELEL